MKILLIIPAYNEEENILSTCKKITKFNNDIDFIVIKDSTEKILLENNLNHINLVNNLGIGGAVQTGYKYAYENDYDIAVQFDGDGQHDISYISNLIKPIIENEASMVIGTRYLDKSESKFQSTFMRRLGSKIISFFIKLCTGKKITDPTSGFRAVDKKIIKEFAKDYPTEYPEPESIVSILLKKYKVKEIPVNMNERQGGESSIRFFKTVDYMLKVPLAIIIDSTRGR